MTTRRYRVEREPEKPKRVVRRRVEFRPLKPGEQLPPLTHEPKPELHRPKGNDA